MGKVEEFIKGYISRDNIDNTDRIENLGMDSLDVVEFCMALEEKFDIDITDDELDDCKTVQQFIDLVEKNI